MERSEAQKSSRGLSSCVPGDSLLEPGDSLLEPRENILEPGDSLLGPGAASLSLGTTSFEPGGSPLEPEVRSFDPAILSCMAMHHQITLRSACKMVTYKVLSVRNFSRYRNVYISINSV